MSAIQVGWTGGSVDLLTGKGLPYWWPFRPRRADNVIDGEISECFKNRFSAVQFVFYDIPPYAESWSHVDHIVDIRHLQRHEQTRVLLSPFEFLNS